MRVNRLFHLRHGFRLRQGFHLRQGSGGQVGGRVKRSVPIVIAAAVTILAAHGPVGAQEDPAATYQAAQAAIRADEGDRAREELAKVRESGDETWRIIGRSATALIEGDVDRARAAAQEAVERNGDSPWAHYQLGMVASRQDDFGLAASSFERATELKGDFAYAHYYAGLAFQRQRQSAKAGSHLREFLRLAPDAPEREAVRAIIRTLG